MQAALWRKFAATTPAAPLSNTAIEQARTWVLAACAAGGLGWHEAAARYGEDAAKVFLVYGEDPDFVETFDRLGHAVVPVIAYFVNNGSSQYLLQETVGQGLSRLWNGEPAVGIADISPEQYGLIAVHELKDRGHEMLSEFEIVEGIAHRRQFHPHAARRQEHRLRRRFRPGGRDHPRRNGFRAGARWAGQPSTRSSLSAGWVRQPRPLRVARTPVAIAGRGTLRMAHLRAAGRGAVQSLSAVGTAAGVAAVVAIPYVAITRPDLMTDAAGWIAEQAGLPSWLGAFAAYLLTCLIVVFLLRTVLGPLAWMLQMLGRIVSGLARATGALSRPRHQRPGARTALVGQAPTLSAADRLHPLAS